MSLPETQRFLLHLRNLRIKFTIVNQKLSSINYPMKIISYTDTSDNVHGAYLCQELFQGEPTVEVPLWFIGVTFDDPQTRWSTIIWERSVFIGLYNGWMISLKVSHSTITGTYISWIIMAISRSFDGNSIPSSNTANIFSRLYIIPYSHTLVHSHREISTTYALTEIDCTINLHLICSHWDEQIQWAQFAWQ